MIAFKIEVEGQDPIIAGTEDWHVLSLGLTAIRGKRGKHDHPYERVRADDCSGPPNPEGRTGYHAAKSLAFNRPAA